MESLKILLVEDNPGDAHLLRLYLGQQPVQITHVSSVAESVSKLGQEHWDLVLLDLSLPDSSGLSAIEKVREVSQGTPVVVLTGTDETTIGMEVLRIGADDYLSKSKLSTESILRSMRHALDRKLAERIQQRLIKQQMAIVELGQLALGVRDLPILLRQAVQMVKSTLEVDFCKVLRLLPEKSEFAYEAGIGWTDETANLIRVSASTETQAGYSLTSPEPVIVCDFSTEERFKPDPLMKAHGITSGISVAAIGRDGPYGVLAVHSLRPRNFTTEECRLLQAVANIVGSAAQRIIAERDVLKSEARFRRIYESNFIGICFSDASGKVESANDYFLRTIGYTQEDLAADVVNWREITPAEFREISEKALMQVHATGVSDPFEKQYIRKDGERVSVLLGAATVSEGRDKYVTFMIDLTDKKKMQSQLVLSDKLAALGTLAAGVAHEINNPLTYVILNLQQILEIDPTPKIRILVAAAEDGAFRVQNIVRELRSFSRNDEVEKAEPVQLSEVLEEVVRLARPELLNRAKVTLDLGGIPAVSGIRAKIFQIFLNLLINAAQSFETTDPEANQIKVCARNDGDGFVHVEVRDNGPGISEAILPRIFDPFFTTKAPGRGTGLGLSICHSIATSMGGSLTAESRLGHGATLKIRLPISAGGRSRADGNRLSEPAVRHVGASVLVVDDDLFLMNAVERTLSRHYNVRVTNSGTTALEWLADGGEKFDLILCDISMPQISGMALFTRAVELKPELAAKFVFITGGATSREADAFLKKVKNSVLSKPFSARVLLQGVEAALGELEQNKK